MYSLCVTGGIATGKSTFSQIIQKLGLSLLFFDADQEVRKLYGELDFLKKIKGAFGVEAVFQGAVNKEFLRTQIFNDPGQRRKLEGLIHPLVRIEWLKRLDDARKAKVSLFVSDIPLYFENKFNYSFDGVLTVACSAETQLQRLLNRSKLDQPTAKRIISSQIEIDKKMKFSDFVIWNEGDLNSLKIQSETLMNHIYNV